MDCKRVTVIRIGPVISTRTKKRLSQPAGRDKRFLFYCAPRRILKS